MEDLEKASRIVSEIIKSAGESESAKAAANNMGKTAVTITETINNALLPLAAVNFAFEKARLYFKDQFSSDISKASKHISPSNVINPNPSIAGPALQGLAFCHKSEELRDMYLNLLASAMDASKEMRVHTAHVEILKQITPFEAQILGTLFLESATEIARVVLVDTDFYDNEDDYKCIPVGQHLLNLRDSETNELSADTRIELMIENFIRLGLCEVRYGDIYSEIDNYAWAKEHPRYLAYVGDDGSTIQKTDGKELRLKAGVQYGILELTAFGRNFSEAVGVEVNTTYLQRYLTIR